jgi:ABC-type glycerol-3-phosphate transport system substrate-binding protein
MRADLVHTRLHEKGTSALKPGRMASGVYQEGVFYNKQIFAQYHLSPPTTYSQFLSVLNTLKANHVQPLWLATGGPGDPAGTYLQFIYYGMMSSL